MDKVLAVNINGDLTYCTAPEEMRGYGRCNHIDHQKDGESTADFIVRIENVRKECNNKNNGDFIPYEGTTIETKPYRISDEEKEDLKKIENRMQLDQNIEGGYIELKEPLWNDMDKNYFAEKSGIFKKNINGILEEEIFIVLESDNPKYPVGKVLTKKANELLKEKDPSVITGTGVCSLNKYSKDVYDWEATRDVYVLPYYMRMGFGEEIDSDITLGYKYFLRQHKNPQKQQAAYEALLNNSALSDTKSRYNKGYRNKSLADEFVGKGGVFRSCLSGSSIPYSARAVVTPTTDMSYGEIKIPPSMAVDIYRPTLLDQLTKEGKNEEEIDEYFSKFRVPQVEVKNEDRNDLERRIKGKRVIMNRQPSLHTSSLQSFSPKISNNATVQVHPLYCESYGMDFDGDTVSIYAINQESMIPVVDRSIGANNKINTQKPRNIETSAIMPSKDALWGLLNILDKRTI